MGKDGSVEEYRENLRKKYIFILGSSIGLFFLFLVSISIGPSNISFTEIFSTMIGDGTSQSERILWNIRFPRVAAAVVAGSGLAVAGTAMQSILRNPLGSPYTLGISHAAAFGAAFAIIMLGGEIGEGFILGSVLNNPYVVSLVAFLCSLSSALIILVLARWKSATPATMVLTGIALGSLFTSGYTAIQYFASQTELSAIVFWTFGDLSRATWGDIGFMTVAVILVVGYFVYRSWDLNVLDSGDESARSLGVNVESIRMRGMVFSCFVTALIVSFVGIIGFVGLVVPHIVRKAIGSNEIYLIPASCIFGSALLVASDTAARTVLSPEVLPVGILTSFFGAPLFIYLVIRGRDYW
ncbi:MAG: FecCD family ABC transporter permease [Candidatus Hadarchaeota archaeon]